jgi:hypothetical protein
MPVSRKKVFVSYDFDNDKVLKEFLIGQSRLPDSPFDVADWSMKEAAPERNWENEARERIRRSDAVIVMLGPKTFRAQGVLKEVEMARSERKPICQIMGYRDATPTPLPNAGHILRWNWENVKNFLK